MRSVKKSPLEQIMDMVDVSDQDPFVAMARLGLRMME